MNRRRILAYLSLAFTTLLFALGIRCFTPSPATAQAHPKVLVSAAISLKDALEDIKPLYQKLKPNVTIAYNLGASGALQQQIEQGAPVDIFISAAQKQMDALEQKNLLVPGTRRDLASNRLVLIVPNHSTGITSFKQLTDAKVQRIVVGEPRTVPAGQYAEEVFKKLGILDQIKSKLVFANNVRQVLTAVESGNADAGVVYTTDAKTSTNVRIMETASDKLHSPIVYPIAVLKDSKAVDAAKDFENFLFSTEAKSIFRKYGFGPVFKFKKN
ncbi:molybdate ABC transporter substrate-binding protein [Leptolyngbya sp. 'hensonii']|uniref:molybdate ABC transporter substrate-binding protein n=1 Tax=Leptolyngbya sp. 'hensonii' TaxID=1922337 RepID=UPI00094F8E58|nr:molybdate ABC transporter substrate-binding protein [Leptolyngbya sp. 'hensonii']OLP16342.1 molybdate ABC transporter substrate-binding protein [Leptolyngbya sp. 'hensonii']